MAINSVGAGFVDMPLSALDEDELQAARDLHPLGRLPTADEVAEAVLFLACDRAGQVTGSHLLVDGGYTAG